jgi:hypothetical protein
VGRFQVEPGQLELAVADVVASANDSCTAWTGGGRKLAEMRLHPTGPFQFCLTWNSPAVLSPLIHSEEDVHGSPELCVSGRATDRPSNLNNP